MATKTKTATAPATVPTPTPATVPGTVLPVTVVEKKKVLIGNIGAENSMSYRESKAGLPIMKFSLAVNDREAGTCTWFNIVTFGNLAKDFHENFHVGDYVRVEGNFKATEYTTKETKQLALYFSLSAYKLELMTALAETLVETPVETLVIIDNIPF